MLCGYCTKEATLRIPAIPDDVCQGHAVEFWKGFLTYAKANRPEPVVEGKPSRNRRRAHLPVLPTLPVVSTAAAWSRPSPAGSRACARPARADRARRTATPRRGDARQRPAPRVAREVEHPEPPRDEQDRGLVDHGQAGALEHVPQGPPRIGLLVAVRIQSDGLKHGGEQRPQKGIVTVRHADDRAAAGFSTRAISATARSVSSKCSIVPIE